jgi:hypothetical protein
MYLVDYGDRTYPSQILILFKFASFFPFLLQQQLKTLDFVSYCGGSLGLFLGFSAVSALELISFFTIRMIFSKPGKVDDSSNRNETVDSSAFKLLTVHGFKNCVSNKNSFAERYKSVALTMNLTKI